MSVQVNNTDNQLSIITNGVLDVYAVKTIKSVGRGVDVSGNVYIVIYFISNDSNNPLRINLSEVTSPVTWTNDAAGAATAVSDIRVWLSEVIEVEISEANDSILVYGFDGVNNQPILVAPSGAIAIQDNGGSITVDGSVSITGEVEIINAVGSPIPVTIVAPVPVIQVNLDAADDQVGVYGYINGASGSPFPLNVNATGQVAIQDGGNSITVDGGTGTLRVAGALRPTNTSGDVNTVADTFFSVSVANVGASNGTILAGVTIKPGEVLSFSADAINNYFNTFAYDASVTEFLITYVTE